MGLILQENYAIITEHSGQLVELTVSVNNDYPVKNTKELIRNTSYSTH